MHRLPRRSFPVLLALLLAGPVTAQTSPIPKQVAAPAEDVLSGILRLPDLALSAVESQAWMVQIAPSEPAEGEAWSFDVELPLAATEHLALALVAPEASHWRLSVLGPDGVARGLTSVAEGVRRSSQVLVADLPGWVVARWDLDEPSTGIWTLRVEDERGIEAAVPRRGWLVLADDGPVVMRTYLSSHRRLSDEPLAVLASVHAGDGPALASGVQQAEVWLEDELGGVTRVRLHDDGLHEDGLARDGIFGALVPEGFVGRLRAHGEMRGIDANGTAFARSAQLAFGVQERRLLLSGDVRSEVVDGTRLELELGAWPLGPADVLHVSAEVWGTAGDGSMQPACWLSRMITPELSAGTWGLALELDGRWLDVSELGAPLELRAVRVQDKDTHVVFDQLERVAIPPGPLPQVVGRGARAVTQEMLMGPLPGPNAAQAAHLPAPRALMLVHGYCSGGTPWPQAHFSQPKLTFIDPNQNRSHDEFAQLMLQTGGDLFSFGVVAHSQGGPAALHLLTYYQSPLDRALGERLIQSVGSPYQGTPLASLGGFACGVNDDLTTGGAATWLAGIPSWARAEVHYWTTSNAGSACNFLASLVLADPEDGTTEMFRGQLPGANSMGHVTGWCHTTGMSEPAQYTDASRNADMNAKAAR